MASANNGLGDPTKTFLGLIKHGEIEGEKLPSVGGRVKIFRVLFAFKVYSQRNCCYCV